ncbi:MAG: hypothetical protein IJ366_01420 [Clostridia bacterium]|nr:hypothetical protein [Clostridia bacterium]
MEKIQLLREIGTIFDDIIGAKLGLYVFVVICIFIVRTVITSFRLDSAVKAATNDPSEDNAYRVYRLLCRFGVGINNHPKDWGRFRDMFYKVNGSNRVPTELKKKMKDKLVKKGLYINGMKIIDNYGKNTVTK